MTECFFEQVLLHFKRKINIDGDMVRHRSSKLNNNTELLEGQLAEVFAEFAECADDACRDRKWTTVLHDHGNNTVN